MKISTNVAGWLRLVFFAIGAAYLWRSALFPKKDEPRSYLDRGLRLFGALFVSILVIYFLGFGLGLYGLISK